MIKHAQQKSEQRIFIQEKIQQVRQHTTNNQFLYKNQIQKSKRIDLVKPLYKYYLPQKLLENGTFDMRFQQILNSPINQGAGKQFRLGAGFQFAKSFITVKQSIGGMFGSQEKVLEVEKQVIPEANQNQIKVLWLGHASVFISIENKINILIDPIFENKILPYVGEKRQVPHAIDYSKLPKIDYVLISHDHLDHCNTSTLQQIYQRFEDDVTFLIGRGSCNLIPSKSKQKYQMSWTESKQQQKNGIRIKITFVPACHWSKRALNQQNNRLWGGFVIQTRGKKIYFAGDTGYCGLFKQLREVFGGFDLSLIPIGAYQPNKFLKAQHINPQQAIIIHKQISSHQSIGIHWGTFRMSHQTPQQVLKDLQNARVKHNVSSQQFRTVNIGGGVVIGLQRGYMQIDISKHKNKQQIKKQKISMKQELRKNNKSY